MAPGSSPNLGHASQRRSVTSVSKALSTCLKRGLKTNKKQKQAAEVHQILVCLCSGRVGGTGGVQCFTDPAARDTRSVLSFKYCFLHRQFTIFPAGYDSLQWHLFCPVRSLRICRGNILPTSCFRSHQKTLVMWGPDY